MPQDEMTAAMTADTARIDMPRNIPLRRHTALILSGPDQVAAVFFDFTGNSLKTIEPNETIGSYPALRK